jgi:YHS domain-containing protein
MNKANVASLTVAMLALAGCGSSRTAVDSSGKTVAVASDPSIAKGIVKDGLYVNKSGVPLCPVTGAPIAKGKEVGKTIYKGVEYHFCCGGCPEDFKSQPAKYAFK